MRELPPKTDDGFASAGTVTVTSAVALSAIARKPEVRKLEVRNMTFSCGGSWVGRPRLSAWTGCEHSHHARLCLRPALAFRRFTSVYSRLRPIYRPFTGPSRRNWLLYPCGPCRMAARNVDERKTP